MANYENAKIFTDNKELREILLNKYSDEQYYFPHIEDNKLCIRNVEGNTHKELEEISRGNPEMITAQYSFSSNRYLLTYELIWHLGEYKFIDIRINYYFDYPKKFKLYVETINQTEIFKELKKFYRKVDKVEFTEKGEYNFNINEEKEIAIKLTINDYLVSAVKVGNEIEITEFKYVGESYF